MKPRRLACVERDNPINTAEFPYCCGIQILGGFGHTKTAGFNAGVDIPLPEIEAWLERQIEHYRALAYAGMLVLSLNHQQKAEIGATIEAAGFKMVSSCHHAYHKTDIYLYTLSLEEALEDEELLGKKNQLYNYGRLSYW